MRDKGRLLEGPAQAFQRNEGSGEDCQGFAGTTGVTGTAIPLPNPDKLVKCDCKIFAHKESKKDLGFKMA